MLRRFAAHAIAYADSRALVSAGSRIEISRAMMPITTRSSTKVNPAFCPGPREVLVRLICSVPNLERFIVPLTRSVPSRHSRLVLLLQRRWLRFRRRGRIAVDDQSPAVWAKRRSLLARELVHDNVRRRLGDFSVLRPVAKFR